MIFIWIILIFLCLGVLGIFIFLTDKVFGGLDFSSKQAVADQVVGIIKQRHLETGIFYDLGSARGGFVAKIARALPHLQVFGIDDNGFRLFCAKLRTVFLKNISLRKENIFKTNVSSAHIIYLYLPQELMPDLQTKLQKELKPGALVITASVSFPSWLPAQVYDVKQGGLKVPKLFIYAKV